MIDIVRLASFLILAVFLVAGLAPPLTDWPSQAVSVPLSIFGLVGLVTLPKFSSLIALFAATFSLAPSQSAQLLRLLVVVAAAVVMVAPLPLPEAALLVCNQAGIRTKLVDDAVRWGRGYLPFAPYPLALSGHGVEQTGARGAVRFA